jgi:hypothetical protein
VSSFLLLFAVDRQTPVPLLDVPISGVVATGSKLAAKVETTENIGLNITTFPAISAAGDKIPLCAVIKGKTDRVFKKIREGASLAVLRVHLYRSMKGWVNEKIMLQWLREIILPYTHGLPAALIMDSYAAHWTYSIRIAAMEMNLELIQVPRGCTPTLQPLDVSFNGPMKKARQAFWLEHKIKFPAARDSQQAAIERAIKSYDAMSKPATRIAWKKAGLID